MALPPRSGDQLVIRREHFDQLFVSLTRRRFQLVGPTVQDGAIVYDTLTSVDDLPVDWTDRQDGGHYRLEKRNDRALFGYVVGPHTWKKFLFPPIQRLWRAHRNGKGFEVALEQDESPAYAFVAVRACEQQALDVQDRVFMRGEFADPSYARRRRRAFVLAVNCVQAGGTCFCVSMNTGPRATKGFDLALTELFTEGRHEFLVDVGSDLGADVMGEVEFEPARNEHVQAAEAGVAEAASSMGRSLDTTEIKDLLYRNYEHPQWNKVADRCLSCANCTMVCPTCFCSNVEDVTDLTGEHAERGRSWDSCFTAEFSYIVGGNIRKSTASRYRQWMTHKLATWIDQFGTSGCVGCGRCITWCPVGIDITEELGVIRDGERQQVAGRRDRGPAAAGRSQEWLHEDA